MVSDDFISLNRNIVFLFLRRWIKSCWCFCLHSGAIKQKGAQRNVIKRAPVKPQVMVIVMDIWHFLLVSFSCFGTGEWNFFLKIIWLWSDLMIKMRQLCNNCARLCGPPYNGSILPVQRGLHSNNRSVSFRAKTICWLTENLLWW